MSEDVVIAVLQTEFLVEAIQTIFQPRSMMIIILIAIIGIIAGALPGLGQPLALAVFFPVTLTMEPEIALMSLTVLYSSSTYGGSIAAILVKIPGTPTSMATILDGYPLSQKGESAFAIGIATMSSFIGLCIGLVGLVLTGPILADFTGTLASHEIFLLTLIGFATVSAVVQGSLMKSLAAVSLGVIAGTVGTDPVSGELRYAYMSFLEGGLNLVVLVIGIFSIPQAIELINQKMIEDDVQSTRGSAWTGISYTITKPVQFLRASTIGAVIGSIPGVGATAANFIAYLAEVSSSSDPESYGEGNPDGIIASEASNNASVLGSLIPTMALAIPGSASTAIFLGAMVVHGITPGPRAFEGSLPYMIYVSVILGGIVTIIIGVIASDHIAKVTRIPTDILIGAILSFSAAGAYAVRLQVLDVSVFIFIGFVGYFLIKYNYSIVAFVLALVLTPIAEPAFQRALIVSGGDYSIFISTRLGIILLCISILTLMAPILYRKFQ